MKRILPLTLFLLLLSSLLIGCADSSVHVPEYAEMAIDCTFDLTVDGSPYRIHLRRAPLTEEAVADFSHLTDATITLLTPDSLAGVTLSLEGQTAHLSSGDLTIPVRREDLAGILSLFACFSLKSEEIVDMRSMRTSPDRTAIVYENAAGTFTVLYNEELKPLSVEYTYAEHVYCLSNFSDFVPEN